MCYCIISQKKFIEYETRGIAMWANLSIIAAAIILGGAVALRAWRRSLQKANVTVDTETRRRHDVAVEPTAEMALLEIRRVFQEDSDENKAVDSLRALYRSRQLPNYILDMSLDVKLSDASPATVLDEMINEVRLLQFFRSQEKNTAVVAAGLNALAAERAD